MTRTRCPSLSAALRRWDAALCLAMDQSQDWDASSCRRVRSLPTEVFLTWTVDDNLVRHDSILNTCRLFETNSCK